ncbi:MAG: hypothetical protein AAFX06_11405 [Planctomycetota bacterium]
MSVTMDMSRTSHRRASTHRASLAGLLLFAWCTLSSAQPPGTFPPAEVVRPAANGAESDQLPIKGFYFLDATKNPVLVPGMTYERLTELDSESNRQSRRYIFEQVKISGRVEGSRAEMMVEVQLDLESTGGEILAIPLRMENFHRISPPEFLEGSDGDGTLAITTEESTGGYLLLASSSADKKISFRMRMSSRVDAGSASVMQFSLPTAPVVVELTTDSRDARGEIMNRNDEVLETRQDKSGRSQFLVESGGGRFTLRWGAIEQQDAVPLLEASTKMTMRWNSPQDQPIQIIQMVVRDLRESIERFQLRLPNDAVLLDAPVLANSGQALDFSKPNEQRDPQLYEIVIPKEEQRQRIDLNLELHLPLDEPATSRELEVRVPEVVGALRHQGTVEIQTGNDYRLRWRDRPYVQMERPGNQVEGDADSRDYVFRFSRGSFSLPIWMGQTKRQLRVTNRSTLELAENYVNLSMEIQPVGNERGSQVLAIDLGDWESPQVTSALTGTPLTWYDADGLIEIEAISGGMDELSPILIRARKQIDSPLDFDSRRLDLAVPRVVSSRDESEPIVIQESKVQLVAKGRSTMVVDLEASPNVERTVEGIETENQRVRNFRVVPPDAAASLSGVLVEEPPRLVLDSMTRVSLVEQTLKTIVDWDLESQVDLRGRLQVAISEPSTGSEQSDWSVTVNGSRAVLIAADNAGPTEGSLDESGEGALTKRYELVSDQLSSGTMRIRLECSLEIAAMQSVRELLYQIAMPRPTAEDLSLQSDARVELFGDAGWSLSGTDLDSSNELTFSQLPETLPLRLTARTTAEGELLVKRLLIRSAVSEVSQHDQVIAATEGTGSFRLRLRDPEATDVRVFVDEELMPFELNDDELSLAIEGDGTSAIDIRLWSNRPPQRHLSDITPLVIPSREINRLDWDVTVPSDRHLIWASPSASRSMQWVFDGWRMVREPLYSETELINRVASVEASPMPDGNRYQFSAMDGRSLKLKTSSMTAMWMTVATSVLVMGCVLAYFPGARQPLTLIALLVLVAGVVCIAPDAVIIAGQVAMGGGVLISVMLALRSLVRPAPSRVLESTVDVDLDPSTRVIEAQRDDSAKTSPTRDEPLVRASIEATR